MDHQYQHFGASNDSSDSGEQGLTPQTGLKKRLSFILYSVLLLLLLAQTLIIGVKLTQLTKEVNDVKVQLQTLGSGNSLFNSGSCTEGWFSYQRSCYLLSSSTATWNEAEQECRAHRGHLLVLNDVKELDFISQVVEIKHDYWIGLVERKAGGGWSWVDGTNFSSTPTFWDEGQPDNWDLEDNGEDCGQLPASVQRQRKLWSGLWPVL